MSEPKQLANGAQLPRWFVAQEYGETPEQTYQRARKVFAEYTGAPVAYKVGSNPQLFVGPPEEE